MKLLVIPFLVRLYARINTFKLIQETYGRIGIKVARSIEIYRTKLSKIKCNIDFLLTCKRNNLIPTFMICFCFCFFSLCSIHYYWTSGYICIEYLCLLTLQTRMCRFSSISLSVTDRKNDVYTE